MRHNPERLAWTILLTAFATLCLVTVSCPLSVRSYLRSARQSLPVQVSAQRGTVRVERGGSSRVDAISLDSPPLELFKGDGVRTGDLEEGLLTVQRGKEENRKTLVSAVVYDGSDVVLVDAYSPRFGPGPGPHKVILKMQGGRVRIEVQPAGDGRPVQAEVRTGHARVQLSAGSYVLEVTNGQTAAIVRSGQANLRVGDQQLTLADEQRAVASLDGMLDGPLPAEHNLIVNSDFSQGIGSGWIQDLDPSDPTARISIAEADGQPVAQFQHDQAQPLEIGLIQTLNRNVRDLESLVLHLKVRVNYQSLPVCGMQGSECPVMVRIDYRDAGGGNRQWVHGFYALGAPDTGSELPYYCLTCPEPRGNHDRVPEATWFLYDSPNLMEILQEFQPTTIQSVRVYASGHSYDSMVADVELLAQE
jgi:hypothetical protein